MANEKRLIDANALMAYIHNHDYELVSRMGCVDKGMFTDGIEHGINIQPTVDAVEVVHGHWYFTEYEYFVCSVCGFVYYNGCECSSEAREILQNGDAYRYCPHCGAKMDGD